MIQFAKTLLRGDANELAASLAEFDPRRAVCCGVLILLGCGVYGATVGLWRAPVQGLFTAAKFPLLIFLTCAGNALLNGMLAQILGSGLSFRQTSLAILLGFATAAVLLGALAPLTFFVLRNAPPLGSAADVTGHSIMLLTHVVVIAYAGVLANQRLFRLLEKMSGSRAVARRVLLSWLAGNLFLGAQLAWTLRPFIGSPRLPVQFLRDDPLRGNFYEAVFHAARHLFF
ncbi:MAG TPA: hypothetical protein VK474_01495 [Chthoniobacterales bacterium]|nr:hypothetical protein [Chthoniobacterales bacterium]